jgi:hypothetical protein
MHLDMLKSRIHSDLRDMKEIVEMSERLLTEEGNRLVGRVSQELEGFSGTEQEFMKGWYSVGIHRLDKVFPNIQRRALFTTAMCMTESNLLLVCAMCQRAFDLPHVFKKKGNQRIIVQVLSYLQSNFAMRPKALTLDWETLQHYWTLRNCLVHNDGKPKPSELKEVTDFCAPIPTIELDQDNRLVFHEGSVSRALHVIGLFFDTLLNEIERNKLKIA